jgi:hypothetical protein
VPEIFARLEAKSNFLDLRIFIDFPNMKFHGNPSSGSRSDTYGQRDRRKEMTKVVGTLRGYENASEN